MSRHDDIVRRIAAVFTAEPWCRVVTECHPNPDLGYRADLVAFSSFTRRPEFVVEVKTAILTVPAAAAAAAQVRWYLHLLLQESPRAEVLALVVADKVTTAAAESTEVPVLTLAQVCARGVRGLEAMRSLAFRPRAPYSAGADQRAAEVLHALAQSEAAAS